MFTVVCHTMIGNTDSKYDKLREKMNSIAHDIFTTSTSM